VIRRTISLLQKDAGGILVQSLSPPFRSGTIATGGAKLLQNVIAELMTIRGSVRFHPTFGCDLLRHIGVTNITSLSEAGHLIHLAVSDVQDNIRRRVTETETPEETLDKITVEQLRQEQDRIIFTLQVHSRAGEVVPHNLALTF